MQQVAGSSAPSARDLYLEALACHAPHYQGGHGSLSAGAAVHLILPGLRTSRPSQVHVVNSVKFRHEH